MNNPIVKPELINEIKDLIIKREETIAVAESVTSGLLQVAFSQAVDASKFYQGGITAYNVGQKVKHLNVEPIHALNANCISEKVAAAMALDCCRLFNSNWAVGITGYATITPGQNDSLFAYYAIAHNEKVVGKNKIEADKDEPFAIQLLYATHLLTEFERLLQQV